MTMTPIKLSQPCHRGQARKMDQRGMTLIIAMIFLLVLSLLGVTAMQSTVLEERIAGNTRDRDVAFQSAESGLRAGESFLTTNACSPGITFPGAGLINNVGGASSTVQYDSADYWMGQAWDASDSKASGTVLAGVVTPARYVIELISGTSGVQSGPVGTSNTLVYRVTAKGAGVTAGSVSLLQSTFTVVCSF